jgi:L-fuculose-phosphate aldolase
VAGSENILRRQIVAIGRRMNALGINQGSSGNVSARTRGGFLITPSAVAYERMTPSMIVAMDATGRARGALPPSSEWRMHADIYRAQPQADAVVHCHSSYATALACLGLDIPAFHYMVAVAGGDSIRCARYATFGTQALSDAMLQALDGRRACLLAQHGQIAFGVDLDAALGLAVEVETLAKQYWIARQIGEPRLLDAEEMARVLDKFRNYGRRPIARSRKQRARPSAGVQRRA